MRGVNKVFLLGNLGKEPELNLSGGGDPVANFSVATSESWTDKQGNKSERTEWHRCVAFKKMAEVAKRFLTKGTKVYIEGQLRTNKWDDKQGVTHYSTEIIVQNLQILDGFKDDTEEPSPRVNANGTQKSHYPPPKEFEDDDIPF